ncbi:MAG: exodeoxyribonuclease V subunit alpha [Acidimicrobiales bacterium]
MKASGPLLGDDVATLAPFVEAGVLDASAVHVAGVIARSVGGVEPEVLLGAALAARAPRFGHVCVVTDTVAGSIVVDDAQLRSIDSLDWPDPVRWARLLEASRAVCGPDDQPGELILPLVWDGTRLYLERYWRFEKRVADELLRRARSDGGLTEVSPDLDAILEELFGPDNPTSPDLQRDAVTRALSRRIAVIAGGPGTGKTRTIARLVGAAHAVALAHGRQLDVALAAPTGKAAERMTAAVHEAAGEASLREGVAEAMLIAEAKTLHRLLGAHKGRKPRHDRFEPLPNDLVVVDETSMVSLPLMARLLDAVRPDATLVLVGDPFQLASVEAGAVLGEIVGPRATGPAHGPLAAGVVLLERAHRFAPGSEIAALADAIRLGDGDSVMDLLRDHRSGELTWVEDDDRAGIARLQEEVAATAVKVVRAGQDGDAEGGLSLASELKVLCATRFGAPGVSGWSAAIEALTARVLPDAGIGRRRYVGQPIIVTRNDYFNHVFNGDVGLVVPGPTGPVAAFGDAGGGLKKLAMSQLGDVDTWWATTIHKSQGSEFERVIVTLPRPPSPILTRELLYTAVTRARQQVTLVAAESSLRAAIARPVARASGLGPRLWP